MDLRPNLMLLAAAWLVALPAAAAAPDAAEHDRQRRQVRAEIERLNGAFAAEEQACRQRFVVTACVDDVLQRRRDTLAPLRLQLLSIDEAERRERAEAREAAIVAKRLAQQARPEAPAPVASAPRAAAPAASAPPQRRSDDAAARQQAAGEAAARRVEAARRRQQQADADAERVRRRIEERERSGKAAAPLPVPPAASR